MTEEITPNPTPQSAKLYKFPTTGTSVDEMFEESKGKYSEAFIIGYDEEGMLSVSFTGDMTFGDVNWLIDRFKQRLMDGDYEDDNE